MQNNEAIPKEWQALDAEVCEEAHKRSLDIVITEEHCPQGYVARFCVRKKQKIYQLKEEKARDIIFKPDTGEAIYETGSWRMEKWAEKQLRKAIAELEEVVAYRKAMAAKR